MDNLKLAELKKEKLYLENKLPELEQQKSKKQRYRIATVLSIGLLIMDIFIPKDGGFYSNLRDLLFLFCLLSIVICLILVWTTRKINDDELGKVKDRIQEVKIAIIDAEHS